MVDISRILFVSLILAITSASVYGDELQNTLVEEGVMAHKDGQYEHAKSILLPLAEAGHPKAINIIGMMYESGSGFPKNAVTGCDFFEKAAQLGYASGMYNLSLCHHTGEGRTEDLSLAKKWMSKSAELGSVHAMAYLAVQLSDTEEERRHWLKKASDAGSKYAAALLWIDGHIEDAPYFSLLDEACIFIKIIILEQGIDACD